MQQPEQLRRGFTKVEVILVIAILTLVVGLAVPAVQKVREAAARTQTINMLTQVGKATHKFAELYCGKLP
jgi:prepilin-type N-terminal cleavage/methylation domain-containing protein